MVQDLQDYVNKEDCENKREEDVKTGHKTRQAHAKVVVVLNRHCRPCWLLAERRPGGFDILVFLGVNEEDYMNNREDYVYSQD